MTLIYILLFISFFLEGVVSNFIPFDTNFLNPLFSFVAIMTIGFPFLQKSKKYYIICFIYGMLYDIVYTNTLFLHGILFLLLGYIGHYILHSLTLHLTNIVLFLFISITLYRIFTYGFLCLVKYVSFSSSLVLHSITSSLILNILYAVILYLILSLQVKKKNL